jgi:hypothetical protein
LKDKIENQDFIEAGAKLGIEPAAAKAIFQTEAPKGPFLPSGRPPILFEGHLFWKELKKRGIDPAPLAKGNENVLYPPPWNKAYKKKYKGGEKEYERLEQAKKINEGAALSCFSIGAAQILTSNYKAAGYASPKDFIAAMEESAANQLKAFLSFCAADKNLLKALRAKDWNSVARIYNGPGNIKEYSSRMIAEYIKAKKDLP